MAMKQIFVCLLAIAGLAAQAWGCQGHQTVAYLAEKHLTPGARQMVHVLLGNALIDPQLKRFLRQRGAGRDGGFS
jgi:hypothetical protein